MNIKAIESIADAVLYEGYMLYPYRPSAVKNRQRWNFGVVYPKAYAEQQSGADSYFIQIECLIRGGQNATVSVAARFLHSMSRRIAKPRLGFGDDGANCEIVESLAVGDKVLRPWDEASECNVAVQSVRLADLLTTVRCQEFAFAGRDMEDVRDDRGVIAAHIIRTREPIRGSVDAQAARCGDDLFKLTVRISNHTELDGRSALSREEVLPKSLLSAHAVLSVEGAEFISLMDPPAGLEDAVSQCKNVGTWPVLVGEEGAHDAMLAAPIILYDYPQIAPESAGNLFDGTEIDEILALRILTLSDEEKREIRQTGERAGEILERTEAMPPEHFLKLHGVLRGMKPVADVAGDVNADREGQR